MSFDDSDSARQRPIEGASIGWQVHELLRRKGALEQFRVQLKAWRATDERQQAVLDAWEHWRHEYLTDEILGDGRMQDASAGPPGDGWTFERYYWREDARMPAPAKKIEEMKVGMWEEQVDGRGRFRFDVAAWCPSHLASESAPPVHSLFSFCDCSEYYDPEADPDRPLSTEEKYVVCALFHDVFCPGVEKINPWRECAADDVPGLVAATQYWALCDRVKQLHEADRPVVEAFLADVTADIDGHVQTDEAAIDAPALHATASTQMWMSAKRAVDAANRLTRVNKEWSSFWRSFCTKHHVNSRPARKKDGTEATGRRDVELVSLILAIYDNFDDVDKRVQEHCERKAAFLERLRAENGWTLDDIQGFRESSD